MKFIVEQVDATVIVDAVEATWYDARAFASRALRSELSMFSCEKYDGEGRASVEIRWTGTDYGVRPGRRFEARFFSERTRRWKQWYELNRIDAASMLDEARKKKGKLK